jgi:hypothetical protein
MAVCSVGTYDEAVVHLSPITVNTSPNGDIACDRCSRAAVSEVPKSLKPYQLDSNDTGPKKESVTVLPLPKCRPPVAVACMSETLQEHATAQQARPH